MKRMLLIAAVLLCASTANAQWGAYGYRGYQYNHGWSAYSFGQTYPQPANYGVFVQPYLPAPTYNVYVSPSPFTAGPLWRW